MDHLLLVPCSSDGDDVAVAKGREKRERQRRGYDICDFGVRLPERKKKRKGKRNGV
jgi:hypothetical protein